MIINDYIRMGLNLRYLNQWYIINDISLRCGIIDGIGGK